MAFKIEMLPAAHGDCLWLEYGEEKNPSRILIDTGTVATYKALKRRIMGVSGSTRFELFIISHVDADHIEGSLPLLQDEKLDVEYADIWFNGWEQIKDMTPDVLGPVQGEYLSSLLEEQKRPWNKAFEKKKKKAVYVPQKGKLPTVSLDNRTKITILSPTVDKLLKLRTEWEKVVVAEGFGPGDAKAAKKLLEGKQKFKPRDILGSIDPKKLAEVIFDSDTAPANGSSIGVLIEHDGKSCIFAADAHAPVLEESIDRLLMERNLNRLPLDAFKISHHGSQNNTSKALLQKIECSRYLISTNGAQFNHPDEEAIARIVQYGRGLRNHIPTLYFNYQTDENKMWADEKMKKEYKYEAIYATKNDAGLAIIL